MTKINSIEFESAVKTAARSALVTFCTVIIGSLARILIRELFNGKVRIDWKLVLIASAVSTGLVFIGVFLYSYCSLRAARPVMAILDRSPSLSATNSEAMSGFVGMEYYGLILNRTYVVFVARDGLYGWKVEGPVTADQPSFYEPYQEMLNDPKLIRDPEAVRELSNLKGGFFISNSEIKAVEASYKSKWGMGRIAHSGRIRIGLTNGKSREFIALGFVDPEAIREQILFRTHAVSRLNS